VPKLCILTQYFPPEMGAPQARLSELGERLIDCGWDVEALTALPNYPTGRVFEGYDPMVPVVESVGRIRTVRVPLYTSKGGFVRRVRSYFSFVRSAKKHGPRLAARPDLLWVESPPLFIGYAAMNLARRWRCPYVFNVSDLWPESAIRMGVVRPGLLTALASRLERKLYCRAAGVTGQSQEIIEGVLRSAPGTKTEVITNGVEPSRFGKQHATPEARALIGAGEDPESVNGPIFIFAGLLGLAQGLDQLLDFVKHSTCPSPPRFVLVGEGPRREHLEARIREEGIRRVRLLPPQPREKIPALLAAADAAVISLGMSIPGAVPSKIYEAMASELPILLIADGEAARRVTDAECGLVVAPNDASGLAAAACRLAGDAELRRRLGAAGRRAAETDYDRRRIAERLDRFLRERLS
jgi:glycosyltransferase involved in cell wall biosynthesis